MKKSGLQGYLIDKKSADKFGIKSFMILKNMPKNLTLMEMVKQIMVACPPGWGCEKVIKHILMNLGLGEFINPG